MRSKYDCDGTLVFADGARLFGVAEEECGGFGADSSNSAQSRECAK